MSYKRHAQLSLFLFLIITALVGVVIASDFTVYPGGLFEGLDDEMSYGRLININCQPPAISNDSNSYSAIAYAPVTRQTMSGVSSVTARVFIKVGDCDASTFSCTLYNTEATDAYYYKSATNSTTESGMQELTMTINSPYDGGLYHVSCSIPPEDS